LSERLLLGRESGGDRVRESERAREGKRVEEKREND
jgi:hypothetical protein